MVRAEELALRGLGDVEPNPIVGAVVVADGRVVGEGWHQAFGGPHAEVVALRAAGEAARGATVHVTLEPCSTRGKTGPCTEALRDAGVARVVVGCVDPNPDHASRGLELLRDAGVAVELAHSAGSAALIRRFAAGLDRRRPWVIAKWAMSRDGGLAPADRSRRQLSGPAAAERVQAWRASLDAVVVGVGTVLADDPQLTYRGLAPSVRPLRRVVLDPRLRTPPAARLVTTGGETPSWIFAHDDADDSLAEALEVEGARVFRVPPGDDWTRAVLETLYLQGVRRLMVEGGSHTLGRFVTAGLVDQVAVFLTPVELGADALPAVEGLELAGADPGQLAQTLRLQDVRVEALGDDRLLQGFPESR